MRYLLATILLVGLCGCKSLTAEEANAVVKVLEGGATVAKQSEMDYDAEVVVDDEWAFGRTPFVAKTPFTARLRITGRFSRDTTPTSQPATDDDE